MLAYTPNESLVPELKVIYIKPWLRRAGTLLRSDKQR